MSQIIINGQPLYQVDLPEMTLAQWLALPVAERPKEWIRTDAEYTDIPAENVETTDGGNLRCWKGTVSFAFNGPEKSADLRQVTGIADLVIFSVSALIGGYFANFTVDSSQYRLVAQLPQSYTGTLVANVIVFY